METIKIDSLEIFKQATYSFSPFLSKEVNNNAYISVVVTNNCQCNCPYCINSETDRTQYLPVNKAISNIEKLLKNVPQLHKTDVILLGGEPTLHPQLFELIYELRKLQTKQNLGTIRITTNGIKLKNNEEFIAKLVNEENGVEGINISYHNEDFVKFNELRDIYGIIKVFNPNCKVRVNTNVWKGNLDNFGDLITHITNVVNEVDEIRISNIIPKDSFSVNPINKKDGSELVINTIDYIRLFDKILNFYQKRGYAIFENPDTLGFVRYYLIPYISPIIFNYNFDSKVSEQVCENNGSKINTFKCLVNGDISLSWNTKNIINL